MRLGETNKNLSQIQLPEEGKQAMLNLMDIKIENDMKEVIAKIDMQNQKFDVQSQKFDIQSQKFDTLINSQKEQFNQKFDNLKWTIIIIGSAIGIILTIIALKK